MYEEYRNGSSLCTESQAQQTRTTSMMSAVAVVVDVVSILPSVSMICDRPDVANFVPTKVDTNRLSCEYSERNLSLSLFLKHTYIHLGHRQKIRVRAFTHLYELIHPTVNESARSFDGIWPKRRAFKLFDYVLHLLAN